MLTVNRGNIWCLCVVHVLRQILEGSLGTISWLKMALRTKLHLRFLMSLNLRFSFTLKWSTQQIPPGLFLLHVQKDVERMCEFFTLIKISFQRHINLSECIYFL